MGCLRQDGLELQQHAADSAYNAHYDRPAVLVALGPIAGRQSLDAAWCPGLYLRELMEQGPRSQPLMRARSWWAWPGSGQRAGCGSTRRRWGSRCPTAMALSTSSCARWPFITPPTARPHSAASAASCARVGQLYPEDYENLSKESGFLILRLLKPARPGPGADGLTWGAAVFASWAARETLARS
jgi:hypothetical protein